MYVEQAFDRGSILPRVPPLYILFYSPCCRAIHDVCRNRFPRIATYLTSFTNPRSIARPSLRHTSTASPTTLRHPCQLPVINRSSHHCKLGLEGTRSVSHPILRYMVKLSTSKSAVYITSFPRHWYTAALYTSRGVLCRFCVSTFSFFAFPELNHPQCFVSLNPDNMRAYILRLLLLNTMCSIFSIAPFASVMAISASCTGDPTPPVNTLRRQFPDLARQTISGDGYGGEGFTVLPALRDETPATAIMLHGLGGSGEEWGFISLALSFFSLNFVKFIIPTAPSRDVVYLNKAIPSWFDIYSLRNLTHLINSTQLFQSQQRVDQIIEGEVNAGVPFQRIFIIGFSQGGALALTTFLRSKYNIAGCMGVATWLPLPDSYPEMLSESIRNRKVLLMHVCLCCSRLSFSLCFILLFVFWSYKTTPQNLLTWEAPMLQR